MALVGKKSAGQDTTHGPGRDSMNQWVFDAGDGSTWVVEVDAESQRLVLQQLLPNGNPDNETAPRVTIDLNHLQPGDDVKLRETAGCVGAETKYAMFLRSDWYDEAREE